MLIGLREPNPYPGVQVIYAPNDDNGSFLPEREDLALALRAAREVAANLKAGRKTLVTCWQGRNRSGLVSALALYLHLGCSGEHAVRLVQHARRGALTNPMFDKLLSRLQPQSATALQDPL
jgi:protein-tyrosine phosphatase